MYRLRPCAEQDIRQIYEISRKHFGGNQAEKYFHNLFTALRKLDECPDIGADYSAICQGIRGFRMQSHIIFCIHRGVSDIEIVRILHKRMDHKRHL